MSMLGEDEEQILRMVVSIVSKQLMMTSRTDSPNVVPGGLSEEILRDRLEMVQFGWTTRGHIGDEQVRLDFFNSLIITFHKQHSCGVSA